MKNDERNLLRELATRVRAAADDPVMPVRRELWKRHNALRGERPLVLCYPEEGWREILPESALVCGDPVHRNFERRLRAKLFWWEQINDDNTLEPFFDVGWKVSASNFGVEVPRTYGERRGSFVWDPPVKDLSRDLPKLHRRTFAVDREGTMAEVELAAEIFGDMLPPRIRGGLWWTTGLTQDAAYLIGLEQLMWAMVDQPEELHRLMALLRDDCLAYVTWCEKEGLLTPNTGPADYVGSGGVGTIDVERGPGPARLADNWGFAEAQETVGVSPAMFHDFVMPYQLPLLERFALNCYGCCEGLEHRIDVVLRHVPRLRRVSVAPAADQEVIAEALGGRYVFSRKPRPENVCVDFSEERIRADLRRTLRAARGQTLEFVLKDTHTVENDPSRFGRWVRIARQEIERGAA